MWSVCKSIVTKTVFTEKNGHDFIIELRSQ